MDKEKSIDTIKLDNSLPSFQERRQAAENSFNLLQNSPIKSDPKELDNGIPSLGDLLQATEDFSSLLQEIPMFEVWGTSVKKTAQDAAILPKSNTATKAFKKTKVKENAMEKAACASDTYKVFTFFETVAAIVEIANSIEEICSNSEDSLGKTSAYCYLGEGAFKAIKGVVIIASKCPKNLEKLTDGLGKFASLFKIAGGGVTSKKAIDELSKENLTPQEKVGAICDWLSGSLDVVGGGFELSAVFAPLALPLGVLSSAFSIAGDFFRNGDEFWGCFVVAIGVLISAVIFTVIVQFNTTIATAFGLEAASVSTTLMVSVVGIVAGLAILAAVGVLIAEMVKSTPKLAQGGFPITGQTFIAREAGPELVGTIGGRSAVVNNDQIVEAVACGVYGAFRSALGSKNATVNATLYLDGKRIDRATGRQKQQILSFIDNSMAYA